MTKKNSKHQNLSKSLIIKVVEKKSFKRCLIRLLKGVVKGLKGHLLQAKRASFQSQKMMF